MFKENKAWNGIWIDADFCFLPQSYFILHWQNCVLIFTSPKMLSYRQIRNDVRTAGISEIFSLWGYVLHVLQNHQNYFILFCVTIGYSLQILSFRQQLYYRDQCKTLVVEMSVNVLYKINLISGLFILVQALFPGSKFWKIVKIIYENKFSSEWRKCGKYRSVSP